MTETEATYTTEPLPECETGSAERMLDRAIFWQKHIIRYMDAKHPMFEDDLALLCGQKRLIENILAKMRAERGYLGTKRLHECPRCHKDISVAVRLDG